MYYTLCFRNNYISQLQKVSAAGNTTSYPLDVEILKFLDEGDVSNPWLYMHKKLEDCENLSGELGERKDYLEVKKCLAC